MIPPLNTSFFQLTTQQYITRQSIHIINTICCSSQLMLTTFAKTVSFPNNKLPTFFSFIDIFLHYRLHWHILLFSVNLIKCLKRFRFKRIKQRLPSIGAYPVSYTHLCNTLHNNYLKKTLWQEYKRRI